LGSRAGNQVPSGGGNETLARRLNCQNQNLCQVLLAVGSTKADA
jgi:hypothetical protein